MSKFLYNIDEDSRDAKDAVRSAKNGQWETVNSKLDKKPYLVNCIPEDSAWGILHQAVYWNNFDAVTKILHLSACDALIKTKQCRAGEVGPSKTAIDIANAMGDRERVKSAIQSNIDHVRDHRFSGPIIYVVSRKNGELNIAQLPLFVREIALYKATLLGNADVSPKDHLVDLMKQIFSNERQNWPSSSIENRLHQAMYGFDKAAADEIGGQSTERGFFEELIRLYTSNHVYMETNKALQREFPPKYKPPAQDMALGLYAMLFDMVLAFWEGLDSASFKTYRGVKDKGKQYPYIPGHDIMFNGFVSTSTSKSQAYKFAGRGGTVFEFDNTEDTRSRPRSIAAHSHFPNEKEYIFAVGAEFNITEVGEENGRRYVNLKLLKQCVLCSKE